MIFFIGLPSNWSKADYVPPKEPPCALEALCVRFERDVLLDVKEIKHYYFKKHIESLVTKRVLRFDLPSCKRLLEQELFDFNLKSINREYESYVLNKGDFDERVFLGMFFKTKMYIYKRLLHVCTQLILNFKRGLK